MTESKDHRHDGDMDIIMEADKQAEIFQCFMSLAEKIRPTLQDDGANFNIWSRNLFLSWTTYFMGNPDYFHQTSKDENVKRNIVAPLFIQHSIEHFAYESVTSRILNSDARQIYQALKDQFNRPSWSSFVFHASTIFQNWSDQLHNIKNFANSVTEAIHNLENQLGHIDSDALTTLAIYFAVPLVHQFITPAINTLMATNPSIRVCPDDLLNMIRQISTASPSFDHSTELAQINAASRFGARHPGNAKNQLQLSIKNPHDKTHQSQHHKPTTKISSSKYPCHYCGEVGQWSPNCPIRARANKARSKSQQQNANVASIEAAPALLDSGETHSVVGNISLFTSLVKTDMTLLVASSQSFDVDAVGKIKLKTQDGILEIDGVLYFKDIPGVVLSLGHLIQEKFSVSFFNHHFALSNSSVTFNTHKRNNQWFIPFYNSHIKPISIKPLASNTSTHNVTLPSLSDISTLWN
ncbi:hypothetical protein O181_076805 [Austropuccinia psidii MF-1]|uniref:Retrovirus-related Pol polyprotein from transposon TNT 1-94-like beta-barrel domain-containing protein n=1 Tax=Austropuccinia psidii MF-1 TaxID=1389203 RepID=A0A9Q3F9I6_9BASI|nr:hypothetical protein [Austropuccinia psidii MF-1]